MQIHSLSMDCTFRIVSRARKIRTRVSVNSSSYTVASTFTTRPARLARPRSFLVAARLCARSREFELLHRHFHVDNMAGLQRKRAAVWNPLAVRGHGEGARARIGHVPTEPNSRDGLPR